MKTGEVADYISDFIEYLKKVKGLSDRTIVAYESDLRQFSSFEQDLIQPNISAYFELLISRKKLKKTSARRKIVTLKAFYAYLENMAIIEQSPFYKVKLKIKQEHKKPKTLAVKEVSKILEYFKTVRIDTLTAYKKSGFIRDVALLDLLISTGICIGEAAEITLDDVLIEKHSLLIHGRKGKQRVIYISSPVTWKRIVTLLNERKLEDGNSLFVNSHGATLSIHGIDYIYKKYLKKAGISEHSTPMCLRHTFAANLLENGADICAVQRILGHASVASTQVYADEKQIQNKQTLGNFNYRNTL